jgi:hypothetical protein
MKNSGGRPAGTIFGAMFIKEFVEDRPWIHLDIAGTSWAEKDAGHIVKGPTAVGLRPMVALAELMGKTAVHSRADEAAYRRLGSTSASADRVSSNWKPKARKARKTKARAKARR